MAISSTSTQRSIRERAAQDTMAVWGPNVTLAFMTTRMEDIGKTPPPKAAEEAAASAS